MYKGGIFDHIGYGFSRYSTDRYFLVPHFEKMLYDNALLICAYSWAFSITQDELYRSVAIKTAEYVLRELSAPTGGFYSAQDADSEGVEGRYYVFQYNELLTLLGEDAGRKFNAHYGITPKGNFEGENIANLLSCKNPEESFDTYLPKINEYRKSRTQLHTDDKILTAWNGLMIASLCTLSRVAQEKKYLDAAKQSQQFIENNLSHNNTLYVSFRNGKHSGKGFLDDYAFYIYALLHLYEAEFDAAYLDRAVCLCRKTIEMFFDPLDGGFFLYGSENEPLILKPKETYDGALPSGNSVMTYNLVKLSRLSGSQEFAQTLKKQLSFMSACAENAPSGHCFFLLALLIEQSPGTDVVCVLKEQCDAELLKKQFSPFLHIRVLHAPTEEYPLLNGKTTYYICKDRTCLPPTNHIKEILN